MSESGRRYLARLCLNGVVTPFDYLLFSRMKKRKGITVEYTRAPFNISRYTDDECKIYFRFSHSELARLAAALGLQKCFVLRSRVRFTGLEGLCILLRRLAYPSRLNDLVSMFNRDATVLSRIFNFMLTLVYDSHAHALRTLSRPWLTDDILNEFTEACSQAGSPYPNIVGFIDGTNRPICRPKYNQKSYYSGYKRKHCVKYQSILLPNGLIGRLDGPYIGRRHDSAILHLSHVLDEMKQRFVNSDGTYFAVYGDPGYSNQKFIKVGFKNQARLNADQKQFNQDISSLRVSVEYGFGQILKQFAYLDFAKNQKINEAQIKKQYFVAALFTNCQTCLRGNQVSSYFSCSPPALEEYLN